MTLFTSPEQNTHPGIPATVPAHLQQYLLPWEQRECLRYDFGHVLLQQVATSRYKVSCYHYFVDREVTLYPETSRPTVALIFCLSGGTETLPENHYNFFYIPKGRYPTRLAAGTHEFLYVELSPSDYLDSLAQADPGFQDLLTNYRQAFTEGMLLKHIVADFMAHHVVNNLKTVTPGSGGTYLAIEMAMLHLLFLYQQGMQNAVQTELLPDVAGKETLLLIREDVMKAPNAHTQTLAYFARKHYMSAATLKRNFKVLFGTSLHTLVYEQCMQKARYLLMNTRQPLVSISEELGYEDPSYFTKAFKHFFGYLPSQLRKTELSFFYQQKALKSPEQIGDCIASLQPEHTKNIQGFILEPGYLKQVRN